jgi:hypothetical protein
MGVDCVEMAGALGLPGSVYGQTVRPSDTV